MTKEKIKKIIATADYTILSLPKEIPFEEREQFWKAVEELVWDGTLRERSFALLLIGSGNRDLSMKLLPLLIDKIDIEKEAKLLPEILSIIRDNRCHEYQPFCMRILEFARETKNEEIFDSAYRCLLVIAWSAILPDLLSMIDQQKQREVVDNLDFSQLSHEEREVVDNLAFFQLYHDEKEWQRFQAELNDEQLSYVTKLAPKIKDRLENHYKALN